MPDPLRATGTIDDADQSRPALMVLFHFPPLEGVAVPRNVRNVESLPHFGWSPVVVCPSHDGATEDGSYAVTGNHEVRVIRARNFEPRHLRGIVDPVRELVSGRRSTGHHRGPYEPEANSVSISTAAGSDDGSVASADPAPSWLWRLYGLLSFPDSQVLWFPFALVAALRAHREERFEVIYSTAAPITAHLVAGAVKRLTGVPWVAEFRDPWVGSPVAAGPGRRSPWLHRRLRVPLERWIIGSADRIVFVSPSTTRLYRRRYPDAAPMVTVTNGHDRNDAPDERPTAAARDGYRIVWTGTLDRPEELRIFLTGLEALTRRRPDLVVALQVDFYGRVAEPCRAIADQFLLGPLGHIIRFPGFVPRAVAIRAIAEADAALIMLGPAPGMGQFVPSKLFEYLGQDRQVLAMLPPGDARDILTELDWGVIAEPDPDDVDRALERLLANSPPGRPADPEGRYDREMLVERLAETFTAAAAPTRAIR